MSLFVDSSVWYAAADRADRSHARAKAILSKAERGVTTDHVLVETWLLLLLLLLLHHHHHHRLGKHAAERFWGGLKSGVAAIESVTAADLEVAWAIGDSFPNQDFSIVDRTSFAVMQRLGIRQVSAFDDDFAVYRYGWDRKAAFDVVRRATAACPASLRLPGSQLRPESLPASAPVPSNPTGSLSFLDSRPTEAGASAPARTAFTPQNHPPARPTSDEISPILSPLTTRVVLCFFHG